MIREDRLEYVFQNTKELFLKTYNMLDDRLEVSDEAKLAAAVELCKVVVMLYESDQEDDWQALSRDEQDT